MCAAIASLSSQFYQGFSGDRIGETFICRAHRHKEPVRAGLRWTAEHPQRPWQVQIRERKCFRAVKVVVDQPARGWAKDDPDVFVVTEQVWQIARGRSKSRPAGHNRGLLPGWNRHEGPTTPMVFARGVER